MKQQYYQLCGPDEKGYENRKKRKEKEKRRKGDLRHALLRNERWQVEEKENRAAMILYNATSLCPMGVRSDSEIRHPRYREEGK